jgi:AraC-like DNA-binding protein
MKHADVNAHPSVIVVEISDPAAAGAGIELIDLDAVKLDPTPFRARRVIVRLDRAAVLYHSTNFRVRTRTSTQEGLVGYVTFGPQARGTANGLPVGAHSLLAAEPGAEARFVVDTNWESVTFLVRGEDVGRHLAARGREGEFRLPHAIELLEANAGRVRSLFDWGKRLVETAARQPELFDERMNKSAAEAELFQTLLQALDTAERSEPSRSDATRQAHSLVVKTAEDYALSHTGDHLHVSDLCEAASVSERALEYAFKEVMGLTPVTFLIRLRLHRVRQALLAASQGTTTVSAEALNWGFWHFGEFSRAYRECFGELPSDTLRRKPGGPPPFA